MNKKLLITLLLIGIIFMAQLPATAQETPSRTFEVSVWYPSSEDPTGYDSLQNNLDVITEVNPFWYSAAPDGRLVLNDGAEDAEKLSAWREAELMILPSIASFGTSAMIEDEATRQLHIDTIVERVLTMDYDGIDIDYEGFALGTRDHFSVFIENLTAALHSHDKMISVTVHAKTADVSLYDAATAQDWLRLSAPVDIFRIMTYDYHNRASEAGPIAPYPWVRDVLAYAASVTDLSKVRLGLPFYGYSWRRPVAVVTWQTVQQWQNSFGLQIQRDPSHMEAMLEIDVRGLPDQTVYVSDAIALSFKLGQILNEFPALGGVAIWGLGGEDPANWDVLRSLQNFIE